MSQTYQTKNYTAHGGAETVIGGKLTFLAGAVIDDQAGVIPTPTEPEPLTPAAAQADSEATSIATLKNDFNDLLAKLRAAGLMATAAEETPAGGGGGESGGNSQTPAAEGGESTGGGT